MTKESKRMYLALCLICLIFLIILGRAFYIQVFKHTEYRQMGLSLSKKNIDIQPVRGKILDKNGVILARSDQLYEFWVTLSDIKYDELDDEASAKFEKELDYLVENFNIDKKKFMENLKGPDSSFLVKKDITHQEYSKLKGNKPRWLAVSSNYIRKYPLGDLASRVIGVVNMDGQGVLGVEQSHDFALRGIKGKSIVDTDIHNNPLALSALKQYEAIDGKDIYITIDSVIQRYTQHWLDKCIEETNSKGAIAIIINSKTGAIISMASQPNFSLKDPYKIPWIKDEDLDSKEYDNLLFGMWKNPAISMLYEPGSVGKILTVSAGLEEGSFSMDTKFDDKTGKYEFADNTTLYCWAYPNSHGIQDTTQAFVNSCNIAFIEMSKKIGSMKLYDYLEAFGITKKINVDLPQVSSPIVLPRDKVGLIETSAISYGYSYAVTPLQMIAATNSIANGGYLLEPYIVKKFTDSKTGIEENTETKTIRQVISNSTAEKVRDMMYQVFLDSKTFFPDTSGIKIGGKTGTAYKLGDNGYSNKDSNLSFLSIAPIDDPKYTVLFIADNPNHTEDDERVTTSTEIGKYAISLLMDIFRYEGNNELDETLRISVPSVIGYIPSNSSKVIEDLGLKIIYTDYDKEKPNQVVVDQFPEAGTRLHPGANIILKMGPGPESSKKNDIKKGGKDSG